MNLNLKNIGKWLYPGIKMKRWMFLIIIGLILTFSGIALIIDVHFIAVMEKVIFYLNYYLIGPESSIFYWIIALVILISGISLTLWSFRKIEDRLSKEFLSNQEMIDVLYENSLLQKGPNIVSLGGGTGLSNLLRGLKKYSSNITAIVTVADDGGSSGKLRDELNILPPGDIRNCLVALADREPLMKKLMQYRFSNEGHLVGHSFGNLFIASMTEVTGDFEKAIKESSKVLALKGQVLPATNENIQLGAIYEDESVKMGESEIPREEKNIKKVFLKPASCHPTEEALTAIKEAEIITVGPGSLYTSILPNLLVEGIAEALKESKALKVYICNVMTQPGETTGYSAGDHVKTIYNHVEDDLFDYIIINNEKGSKKLREKYEEEGSYPVEIDRKQIKKLGLELIEDNLLSSNNYLRHDPENTAKRILELVR